MTGFSLQESLDFISYWLSKNDCNGICKYRLGIKNTKKPSMHVLLPSIFYYFGRNAIILPSRLSHIIPEPGTRPHKRFSEKEAREFERWIKSITPLESMEIPATSDKNIVSYILLIE